MMIDSKNKVSRKNPRIQLTQPILKRFFENVFSLSVPEFSKKTGLPYLLIYNLVNGRIQSLSWHHYRRIFGENPPPQEQQRVDGGFFRDMVDLWVFLNDHITKADLYLEFYGWKQPKKIDYRLFTGHTKTVESRLVKIMEKKFLDNGLDHATIKKWMEEHKLIKPEDRIAYEVIRPDLLFIKNTLGVNPSLILNQWQQRYESGELNSVPKSIYAKTVALKKKAVHALQSGRRSQIERLREEIYGKREGFTPYSEVEVELKFLQKIAGKHLRTYLGRSISAYERSSVKHIASWRAKKIKADCDAFIRLHPGLSILSLPPSYQVRWMNGLLTVLRLLFTATLFQHEGMAFEKEVLKPLHAKENYKNGLVQFDFASNSLGISKKAFDFMVAIHCEIFKSIATFFNRWYLPDRYLEELRGKEFFNLVAAKYELMAKQPKGTWSMGMCMN